MNVTKIVEQSFYCPLLLQKVRNKIVDKINQSALKVIYIYTGTENNSPVFHEGVDLFKKTIKKIGVTCTLVDISDKEFCPDQWDPASSMLYVPAAEASKLDQHLQDKISDISLFVNKGGRFLGQCGSAYWASGFVEFRINSQQTIKKTRPLELWRGLASGPMFPYTGTQPNTYFYHRTVKIKWFGSKMIQKYFQDGIKTNVLLSGGGCFIPSEQEHPHKILGKYQNVSKKLSSAIVKTYVGGGVSVLVHPYFFHGAEHLKTSLQVLQKNFPEHPWQEIVNILDEKNNDLERELVFADILYEAILPEDQD